MTELTVQQLIDNHPKAFLAEKAQGVNAVIQYRLSGQEGGDYIITIKDGTCTVASGVAENPTMTLTADAQDFKDVLTGKADGMKYFMQGKLKLAGDLNLAMKLPQFFKMG